MNSCEVGGGGEGTPNLPKNLTFFVYGLISKFFFPFERIKQAKGNKQYIGGLNSGIPGAKSKIGGQN